MNVTRVHDDRGSHIEPPLDGQWSDHAKLAWKAAVVAHDTGLKVEIHDGARLDRNDQPVPGWYGVNVGSSSLAALDFHEAWTFLAGISIGAEQARRATA